MTSLNLPPLETNDHPAYFGDPLLDRFGAALVESMARVWVLQDRVRVLEDVLVRQGTVTRDQLDSWTPSEADTAAIRAERDAFIRGILDRIAVG